MKNKWNLQTGKGPTNTFNTLEVHHVGYNHEAK